MDTECDLSVAQPKNFNSFTSRSVVFMYKNGISELPRPKMGLCTSPYNNPIFNITCLTNLYLMNKYNCLITKGKNLVTDD